MLLRKLPRDLAQLSVDVVHQLLQTLQLFVLVLHALLQRLLGLPLELLLGRLVLRHVPDLLGARSTAAVAKGLQEMTKYKYKH